MTKEVLDSVHPDIWDSCKLGRKDDAVKLERFITRVVNERMKDLDVDSNPDDDPGSHTLNIDAKWGEGKTHFLSLWKGKLEDNHLVILWDAWKTDFSDDPLVAFFSILNKSLDEFECGDDGVVKRALKAKRKELKDIYPALLYMASKSLFGFSAQDVETAVANKDKTLLDKYEAEMQAISRLRKILKKIVALIDQSQHLYLPVYIMIDELDRCRPTYAITLLERVKHIFSVTGVQFVIATDTEQLCHTVKSVYGSGFDAHQYLKRFFDLQYHFPEVSGLKHAKYLFSQSTVDIKEYCYTPVFCCRDSNGNVLLDPHKTDCGDTLETIFSDFSDYFSWSMRDRIQVFEKVEKLASLIFNKGELHIVPMLFFLGVKHKVSRDNYSGINFKADLKSIESGIFGQPKNPPLLGKHYSAYVKSHMGASSSTPKLLALKNLIEVYKKCLFYSPEEYAGEISSDRFLMAYERVLYQQLVNQCNSLSFPISKYPELAESMGGLSGWLER